MRVATITRADTTERPSADSRAANPPPGSGSKCNFDRWRLIGPARPSRFHDACVGLSDGLTDAERRP